METGVRGRARGGGGKSGLRPASASRVSSTRRWIRLEFGGSADRTRRIRTESFRSADKLSPRRAPSQRRRRRTDRSGAVGYNSKRTSKAAVEFRSEPQRSSSRRSAHRGNSRFCRGCARSGPKRLQNQRHVVVFQWNSRVSVAPRAGNDRNRGDFTR